MEEETCKNMITISMGNFEEKRLTIVNSKELWGRKGKERIILGLS